jgi:hypothetical protein
MIRWIALLAVLYSPMASAGQWFTDIGIAYNLDGPRNGQDFEGGREIAVLGAGYEFNNGVEAGYRHLSHYSRGWPVNDQREEKINMIYILKRLKW